MMVVQKQFIMICCLNVDQSSLILQLILLVQCHVYSHLPSTKNFRPISVYVWSSLTTIQRDFPPQRYCLLLASKFLCCMMYSVLKKTFQRGIVRLFSTEKANALHNDIPRYMKRWELVKYGTPEELNFVHDGIVPRKLKKDQILVKVEAASLNPIDLEMMEGYGRTAMNTIRKMYNVPEFPLVLGRDCSGVIVKMGRSVRRFKVGDEVWCARWVIGDGTHAEYCLASQSEVALKPKTLNHVEAASIPYVACTSWAALIARGNLNPKRNDNNKNILILGGSGGIGTIAIQLCKALGNQVTATCSISNHDLVRSLGADIAIDYKDDDYECLVHEHGPYDIILDARRNNQVDRIGSTQGTTYITLMPPFLPSIDQNGLALGLIDSGKEFYMQTFNNLVQNQGKYAWGLFFPSSGVLKKVSELVDEGKIRPVISHVYEIEDAREALERFGQGSTGGKIVLKV